MKCELCEVEHDGSYGSGRFCQQICARAFSTKYKRQDINLRVSEKLSKERLEIDSEFLRLAIDQSKTWKQVFQKLSIRKTGSTHARIKRIAMMHKISFDHLSKKKDIRDILSFRPNERKGHLREALIKAGREYVCENCAQIPFWNGRKLTLQVDHINGNKFDHRPENLRFLCPNCHTQTETFAWRNTKKLKQRRSVV